MNASLPIHCYSHSVPTGCSAETLATQVWTCEYNSCSDLYGIFYLPLCWEAFCPFGKMSNSCPSKWTGNLFTGRSICCVKIQAWFFCFFIVHLFIIASCPEAEHSYEGVSRTHPYSVRGTLITGFFGTTLAALFKRHNDQLMCHLYLSKRP